MRKTLTRNLLIPCLLGVFPFKVRSHLRLNYWDVSRSIIINMYFIITAIYTLVTDFLNHSKPSDFQITLTSAAEALLLAITVSLWTYTIYKNPSSFDVIYQDFRAVGEMLRKLNVTSYNEYRVSCVCLKLLLLWPLGFISGVELSRYTRGMEDYTWSLINLIVAHLACNAMMYGIALQFMAFTESLSLALSTLNRIISLDEGPLYSSKMNYVVKTHDYLMAVFIRFELLFSPTILVMVMNCLVKSTDNFYKLIKGDALIMSFLYIAWISNMFMQVFILVKAVNEPLREANLYRLLLYRKIKHDSSNSMTSFQTKVILHLMKKKKIKFNLCGFATLDNSLLGKILAAVLTYSIVLSQLNFDCNPNKISEDFMKNMTTLFEQAGLA